MSRLKMRRRVTDLLIDAVTDHSKDEPIVPAATVRWWFQLKNQAASLGERARTPDADYNGPGFQRADHEATTQGKLVKWKRCAEKQREVGWSLPTSDGSRERKVVEEWAARKGWIRVTPVGH